VEEAKEQNQMRQKIKASEIIDNKLAISRQIVADFIPKLNSSFINFDGILFPSFIHKIICTCLRIIAHTRKSNLAIYSKQFLQ
jgi:hypothetical protein